MVLLWSFPLPAMPFRHHRRHYSHSDASNFPPSLKCFNSSHHHGHRCSPPFLPSLLLVLLLLFVESSLQEAATFNCAGSTFQIDSSRPNNVLVMPNSGGAAQYQFVPIEMLTRNVCAPALLDPPPKLSTNRHVITRCDECAKCPQELSNLHSVLTQAAQNANLQSLLVIPGKELERSSGGRTTIGGSNNGGGIGGSGSVTHRQPDNNNALAKFVFSTEEEPTSLLTYCEFPGDSSADAESLKNFSKTSVLFVSISFIILIVISLAWLVFYYVQRFRYAHAKDRLQRRLFNAAKKALTRIPTRPVKAGDKELNSDCPVCIDPYKPGDICRQLPCRHIFHKSCVDPWLLEHRTCPMCKSDILKAFGYHISGRRRAQFSANVDEDGPTGEHDLHQRDREDRLSIESGSESANPFPVVTEVHDPFEFTPSASPQLIQMVNTDGFQIVPLSIHDDGTTPADDRHCDIIQTSIERHAAADDSTMIDEQQQQQSNESSTTTTTTAQFPSVEQCDNATTTAEAAVEFKGMHNNNNRERSQQPQQLEQQSTTRPPQSHQKPPSTGLRLFRAVTGRRHVNANLVHVRSRSFSQQSPFSLVHQIHGGRGAAAECATGDAIIYSVKPAEMMPSTAASVPIDEFGTNNDVHSSVAAVAVSNVPNGAGSNYHPHRVVTTAPGGFRRKSPTKDGAAGSSDVQQQKGQRASGTKRRDETRVDMSQSGTL